MFNSKNLSVIYDMTYTCPMNCKICAMNATTSASDESELTHADKLDLVRKVADLTKIRNVRMDFSGGEILTNLDNISVIEAAAAVLGKDKIGMSTSGYNLNDAVAKRLSHCVSDVEMTMDVIPGQPYPLRPLGYANAAHKAIPFLKKYDISVGIQTVLAHSNCNETDLRNLYQYLCEQEVDQWSLLRFYPSGKGANYPHEELSDAEEAWAVSFIQQLDEENTSSKKPGIDFHYTMKGHPKHSTECRCVRKSIGIMPDGTVTACFWAVDKAGNVDPKFYLGNVKDSTLVDILTG